MKHRRLIEWWRLLLRDTATATPASSKALVMFGEWYLIFTLQNILKFSCWKCRAVVTEWSIWHISISLLKNMPNNCFKRLYLIIKCSKHLWPAAVNLASSHICVVCMCGVDHDLLICPVHRHVLRAVVCYYHAEHESPQSKREGQTWSGPVHLHEPRYQWGGWPAWGAAQSMWTFLSFIRC